MIKPSTPVFSRGTTRRAIQAIAAGVDTATDIAAVLECTEKQAACVLDLLVERGLITEVGHRQYRIIRQPSQPRVGHRMPSAPSVLESPAGTMDWNPDDQRPGPGQAHSPVGWRARLRSWWRLDDLIAMPSPQGSHPLELGPESRWIMGLVLLTVGAVGWATWTGPEQEPPLTQAQLTEPATLLSGNWAGEISGEPAFLQLKGMGGTLAGAITVDVGASVRVVKTLRGTATQENGELVVSLIEQGTSAPYSLSGVLSGGRIVGSVKVPGEERAAWWAVRP